MINNNKHIDRRDFIKAAGVSAALGLGALGSLELWKPGQLEASSKEKGQEHKPPKPRYVMIVDVKKMTEADIQKAQDACHGAHNVPDVPKVNGKPKHEIKWIWKETFEGLFAGQAHDLMDKDNKNRPMAAMCNHCANPPCVRVCPTKATFSRKDGIVAMDPHRCIGCRFCMAGCPYGSRSFNFVDPRPHIKKWNDEYPTRTIGVVEKCSFCSERLAKGKKPACVEVLKAKQALVFGMSDDEYIKKILNKSGAVVAVRKAELSTQPSVFYILGYLK